MYGVVGIVASFAPVCSAQAAWQAWDRIPSIVVISPENDVRLPAVREAVSFWNAVFSGFGSPFRFGEIRHVVETISMNDLYPFSSRNYWTSYRRSGGELYRGSVGQFDLPERLRKVDADVIVALSDGKFDSFAIPILMRTPAGLMGMQARTYLVGIQSPLTRPSNRALNVIAHELGHVVGLDHNDDVAALMCGGAWCWFKFPSEGVFPLTSKEKARLLWMYPRDWRPN